MHAAQKIIDELEVCAASCRAEMHNVAAHDGQNWACGGHRRGAAADKEEQFAGCSMRLCAGDGRIQEFASTLRSGRSKFFHPGNGERAGFNEHGPARGSRERTVFT